MINKETLKKVVARIVLYTIAFGFIGYFIYDKIIKSYFTHGWVGLISSIISIVILFFCILGLMKVLRWAYDNS